MDIKNSGPTETENRGIKNETRIEKDKGKDSGNEFRDSKEKDREKKDRRKRNWGRGKS